MVSVCALLAAHTPHAKMETRLRFSIVARFELVINTEDGRGESKELRAHHERATSDIMIWANQQ